MIISLIVAMDKNRVIGKDNKLPWKLPKELQYVKKTTMGHSLIIGRKNFESIGRALPRRRNIILTRDKNYSVEGCEIVHSTEDVFKFCENEEEIFVFGGEQIDKLFLPYANKLYVTKIDFEFEGDTFFPELDFEKWNEIYVQKGITDEENPYLYYYHIYERNE
ncbi:dihydrofolate reductase [Peribacillus simplex]